MPDRVLFTSIAPERREYAQEHPVNILFTITNHSAKPATVLKSYTPLEGVMSDMFAVERDGKTVPYIGPLVKRAAPQPTDYATIAPGESMSVTVDIEHAYALDMAGNYSIRFRSMILTAPEGRARPDIAESPETPIEIHEAVSDTANFRLIEDRPRPTPKVDPNFSNCTAAQIAELNAALSEAEHYASNAAFALSATPVSRRNAAARYIRWFGVYAANRYDIMSTHFRNIYDALENKKFDFHNDPASTAYAYVYPNNPYHMYLGQAFWNAPRTGTDSKAGTIIHETSHFYAVASTADNVYGTAGALSLAQTQPDKAVQNADSHEYFAENTPAFAMVSGPAKLLVVRTAPSGPSKANQSSSFVDIPDMSASVTTVAGSSIEVTLSAEAYTTNNKRMFVRALVDGVVCNPSDVVFVLEPHLGTRSFTFTKSNLAAGVHDIRLQWLVDSGGVSYVGDRTLTILASPPVVAGASLVLCAAPSGPDRTTTLSSFSDVPDLTTTITTTAVDNIEILVSAEVNTAGGKRMFLRALVDGVPANPSDVVFASENFTGTRAFTFTKENLAPGSHNIKIQWLVDAGGTAYMGDRTLCVMAAPPVLADTALVLNTAPSGPDRTTTLPSFADIPNLTKSVSTGQDTNLEIFVSAEVRATAGKRVFLRALVDNQPADPSDVVFVAEAFNGTRAFTFTKTNLSAGSHNVRVQWAIDSGGTGSIGDRSMALAAAPFAG